MFIEKAYTGKNNWFLYVVTILIVFIATQLSGIPLAVYLFICNPEAAMQGNIGTITSTNTGLALSLLTFVGGFFALFFCAKFLHKKNYLDIVTARPKFDWGRLFFGAAVWAILTLISLAITILSSEDADIVFQFDPLNFFMLVLISILFLPFQTGFEEIMFRGYLMQGAALFFKSKWISFLFIAILFGLMHISNPEIKALIESSQKQLNALGYTEHSVRHITIVSHRAGEVLRTLGYPEERIELAKIAGYMHDIGNCVNRVDHAHTGAILAYHILKDMGMDIEKRTEIMMAIGNHDEQTGTAVSDISAALILADKSDAHRDRVVNTNLSTFDKHDKVNYAVTDSKFNINKEERKVTLDLTIDTKISPVLDYFEIFMDRTMMSKYAAKYLQIWFELIINDTKFL